MINSSKLLLPLPYFIKQISSKKLFRFILNSELLDINIQNDNFFCFFNFCQIFYSLDDITLSPNYPISLGAGLFLNNLQIFFFFFMKLFKKYVLEFLNISYFIGGQFCLHNYISTFMNTSLWIFLEFFLNSIFFFQYFQVLTVLINKSFFYQRKMFCFSVLLMYSPWYFNNQALKSSRGFLLIDFYHYFLNILI